MPVQNSNSKISAHPDLATPEATSNLYNKYTNVNSLLCQKDMPCLKK